MFADVKDFGLGVGRYWRLRDASGKPPGVMGWWPSRAVTFLEVWLASMFTPNLLVPETQTYT